MASASADRWNIGKLAVAILILANCACAEFFTWQDRFVNPRRPQEQKLYANLDRLFSYWCQGGDSVFLRFENFTGRDKGYISTIYYRGVFTAFPARVLVADPSTPLFSLTQILDANQVPSGQWLRRHDVGVVVTIRLQNGLLLFSLSWPRETGTQQRSQFLLDQSGGQSLGHS
jgi:hypothetical protein